VSEKLDVKLIDDVRAGIVKAVNGLGSLISVSDVKCQQRPGHIRFWVERKNGLNTAKTPLQLGVEHIASGGLDGNVGITYKTMPRVIEALWKQHINMVRRERLSSRNTRRTKK
jgi:hypothetical protein